jgi:hypothetical protein
MCQDFTGAYGEGDVVSIPRPMSKGEANMDTDFG